MISIKSLASESVESSIRAITVKISTIQMSTIFHTISGCACGGVGKMTAVLEPKIRGLVFRPFSRGCIKLSFSLQIMKNVLILTCNLKPILAPCAINLVTGFSLILCQPAWLAPVKGQRLRSCNLLRAIILSEFVLIMVTSINGKMISSPAHTVCYIMAKYQLQTSLEIILHNFPILHCFLSNGMTCCCERLEGLEKLLAFIW